jgi:hypothetical protein
MRLTPPGVKRGLCNRNPLKRGAFYDLSALSRSRNPAIGKSPANEAQQE